MPVTIMITIIFKCMQRTNIKYLLILLVLRKINIYEYRIRVLSSYNNSTFCILHYALI